VPVAVNGLIQGLVTLALEIVGLLAAIAIVGRFLRERLSADGSMLGATAVVFGVVVLVIGAESVASSGAQLAQARRDSVGAQQGLEYCMVEDHAQVYEPFINWLRYRLPPHAVYELEYKGVPDPWCLTLALLPRLPPWGSARAGWLVDIEDTSAQLQARIARHDPAIQVYVPGLVLERLSP
jgi:hypothetical protein